MILSAAESPAETAIYQVGSPDPFVGGVYNGVEDLLILQNNNPAGQTDQNYGARSVIQVGEAPPPSLGFSPRRSLVRYDLSSLASKYQSINSVTLRLKISVVNGPNPGEMRVHRLADANAGWVEGTGTGAAIGDPVDIGETTFNQRIQGSQNWAGSIGARTAGTDYIEPPLATLNYDSTASGYVDLVLDSSMIGNMIDDWTTGTNAGLLLFAADGENNEIKFHSSEAAALEDRPQLIINYVPAVTVPGDTVGYRRGAPDPFAGGVYNGVEDVVILQNNNPTGQTDQNYGARADIRVGEAPPPSLGFSPRRSLVRYDVTSLAGKYESINSVTLRLKISLVNGPNPGELRVHRLADANAGWVEGTGTGAQIGDPVDIGETTFNQRIQGSQNWAGSIGARTAGTDYIEPPLATLNYDSTASGYIDLVLAPSKIGTLIDDWTTGTNAGLLLFAADGENNEIIFHGSEAVTVADRPQLIIDYVPKSPLINIAPNASGLRVSWTGDNARWKLKGSTDLQTWTPLAEPTADAEGFYLDLMGSLPLEFFRLVIE